MMADSKSLRESENPKGEDGSRKLSSEQSNKVHEHDHFRAYQEHADARWIAQAVLSRCNYHGNVSDQ